MSDDEVKSWRGATAYIAITVAIRATKNTTFLLTEHGGRMCLSFSIVKPKISTIIS
jgi:hypothetical protein